MEGESISGNSRIRFASKEPTVFSETGLGKQSTQLASTRWIGDARGPVFIEYGARGERGPKSSLLLLDGENS